MIGDILLNLREYLLVKNGSVVANRVIPLNSLNGARELDRIDFREKSDNLLFGYFFSIFNFKTEYSDFADGKKKCVPGRSYPCGNSCITTKHKCHKRLAGQARNYAAFLVLYPHLDVPAPPAKPNAKRKPKSSSSKSEHVDVRGKESLSISDLADSNDKLVAIAEAAAHKSKEFNGTIFTGGIDRLSHANSQLKKINKDGVWKMSDDNQLAFIKELFTKGNAPEVKHGSKIAGILVPKEDVDIGNALIKSSLETANALYSYTTESAKNKWAEELLNDGNSLQDIRDKSRHHDSKNIYDDLAKRGNALIKSGKVQDLYGEEVTENSEPLDFWEKSNTNGYSSFTTQKKCTPGKSYPCKGTCISVNRNCLNPINGEAKNYAAFLALQDQPNQKNSEKDSSTQPDKNDEFDNLVESLFQDRYKRYREDGSYKYMILGNGKRYDQIAETEGKDAADKAFDDYVRKSSIGLANEVQRKNVIEGDRAKILNGKDESLKRELTAFDRFYPRNRHQMTLQEFKDKNPDVNLLDKLDSEEKLDKLLSYNSIMERGIKYTKELDNKIVNASLEDRIRIMNEYRDKLKEMSHQDASTISDSKNIDASALDAQTMIKESATEFYQITKGAGSSTLKKFEYTTSRAYANKEQQTINIGSLQVPSIIFHEMGHHVEFEDSRIAAAARDWRDKRATGKEMSLNEIVGSSRYQENEIAKPDNYISPYVGKIYADGSTEVISMGMEKLNSAQSMLDFYNQDREHFKFIIGVIKRV